MLAIERPPSPRALVVLDRCLAGLLVGGCAAHAVLAIFLRVEWFDWVAYALPAANLIERGQLSTPQLGHQFDFDRFWLFNSPLMGAGPAPFYWAFGTGRVSYLIGMVVLALANLAIFFWACRRALGLPWLIPGVLMALAIVGNRTYLSHYFSQRYDLGVYGAMLLAFVPVTARDGAVPAWRWACAGLLPAFHPALLPASLAWVVLETALAVGRRRRRAIEGDLAGPGRPRPRAWLGPALFAAGWAAALAWYGRPEALSSQFLAHLRFHLAATADGSRARHILFVPAALPYSAPSLAGPLLIAALSAGLGAAFVGRRPGRPTARVALVAAMLAGLVAFDLVKGFFYWPFYVLGLAPCLLFDMGGSPRLRRAVLVAGSAFGVANVVVGVRLDWNAPSLVDQAESVAFVVDRTAPGDAIVLGPPFVLASAPAELPGGRSVFRVVPQPFYLREFDRDAFRAEVAGGATVYLGEPTFFNRVSIAGGVGPESAPLFDRAEVERARFAGTDVIIARRAPGPTPGPPRSAVPERPPLGQERE